MGAGPAFSGVSAGVLALMALSGAWAAYLEQGDNQGSRTSDTEPPRIVRPSPEPEHPLRQLIRRVEIGNPTPYRNLTVFPLLLRPAPDSPEIRTLDEALSREWIALREKDTAQASEILVRNDSKHNVFLMAGEIITGGRQNRILRDDVLLTPLSDFIGIPVYCGEKERWTGARESFSSPQRMADHSLRKMAAGAESQGRIWGEIDAKLDGAKVSAPTRAYQDIYVDRRVDKEMGKAVAEFKPVCRRDTVGAVLTSGGRILCCDLFSDPDLLARLWDKICRSYAIETVLKGGAVEDREGDEIRRRSPAVDREDVRRFLDQVLAAKYTSEDTPGAGRRIRISGAADGAALLWNDQVVHAAIFAGAIRPLYER
jgi:hypothetical protein